MGDLVYLNGNLYHSDDLSDESLAHYGVVGMKWGKRKAAKRGGTYVYKSSNTRLAQRKLAKAERRGDSAEIKRRKAALKIHKQLDAKRQKSLETGLRDKKGFAAQHLLLGAGVHNSGRAALAEGNGTARSIATAGFGDAGRIVNREINVRQALKRKGY